MRRSLILCLGLAAGIAPAAAAQAGGSIDLGVFGRGVDYDKSLTEKTGLGGGGRLGLYLSNGWAIAGDVSVNSTTNTRTNASVSTTPMHLRLEKHWGTMDQLILGAGYAHLKVSPLSTGLDGTADGFTGAIGYQHQFGNVVGLRLDGVLDYFSKGANATATAKPTNINYSVQLGLNFRFAAHQGPKDSDHDGVIDKMDVCPGTPTGTAVDSKGCPLPKDSDHDGVTDDRDACPGTPAGVKVDAKGCPLPIDSDHDGVPDNVDACPGTPAGMKVDARGCPIPIDSDGDGVTDDKDACPGTPAGQKVDVRGCPLPIDSDSDGVTDDKDACPGTPLGQKVDARGCPLPVDSDGDGVPDNLDKCPGTIAGQKVDAVGCPELFAPGKAKVTLQGVTFLSGRAILTPNAKAILNGVAASLAANPTVRVEIGGYTDNTGSRIHNITLSRTRANAVANYLIQKGVSASQLSAKGYGPADPVASNATADGRAENRRVELKKLP